MISAGTVKVELGVTLPSWMAVPIVWTFVDGGNRSRTTQVLGGIGGLGGVHRVGFAQRQNPSRPNFFDFRHHRIGPHLGFRVRHGLLARVLQVQADAGLQALPLDGFFAIVAFNGDDLAFAPDLGAGFPVHSRQTRILGQLQPRQAGAVRIRETDDVARHVAVGIDSLGDFLWFNPGDPQLLDLTPHLGGDFLGDIDKGRGFLCREFSAQFRGVFI